MKREHAASYMDEDDDDNDSDTGDAIDVTNMSLGECSRDLFRVLRSRSRLCPLVVSCR